MSFEGVDFVLPEPPLVDSELLGPLSSDDSVQEYTFSLNDEAPIKQIFIQIAHASSAGVRIFLGRRGSQRPSLAGLRAAGIELQPCSTHSRWLVAGISAFEWTLYYTNATPGENAIITLSIDTFAGKVGGNR